MATCVSCGLAGAPVGRDGLCPKCKRLADADATYNPFALNPFALPRMTSPWKILAVAMAVFGFVYGYVGTAGSAPWACGSVGQCLQWTLDRGFPGFFYPAALVPGAYWALLFGAVAYVLFLTDFGVRKAFHWSVSSPVPTAIESHTPAPANASPTAVWIGRAQRARPTPLLLAVGVALAWGVLSVSPARLADTLVWTIPHDDVRAPNSLGCPVSVLGLSGDHLFPTSVTLEADGMCHLRWGGDPSFLVGDVLRGGENALLAFLAIGAAFLLLRAAMRESSPSRAALRAPMLDIGTSDQPVGPGETVGDKLRQLAALRDDGIISSEEFEAKKAELLRAF